MRDSSGIPFYRDEDVPTGFLGSWHIGNDIWRQRCRACGLTFDSPPGGSVPRWRGIGPHEYEEHGLDVAGINVGILA